MIISPLVSIRAKQAREAHLRLQVKCTKVVAGLGGSDCKHFFVSMWRTRLYQCSHCLVVLAA